MRIAQLIFVGSIAALAGLTVPALAKNSNSPADTDAKTQKIGDTPAAQGCHAYQQAADGSWTPLPCQEAGPMSQAPTHSKSAARHPEEDPR